MADKQSPICGSSGVARGMKMISCRTQYKSYTDENTHIHVLYPQEPIGSTHLSYVREVRTDRSMEVRV
jgi:hypothetical protein